MDDFELPPQHPGQAMTMLICDGPDKVPAEVGHWYSPEKVAKLIAAEREACANVCETLPPRFRISDGPNPDLVQDECAAAIRARSNAGIHRAAEGRPVE
jgi:hypothetical protein